jgi:hypothetical protein
MGRALDTSLTTAAIFACVAALATAWGSGVHGRRFSPKPVSGLCRPQETPLFQCTLGKKQVAVCASGQQDHFAVQYRFGRPGNIELAYPSDPATGPGTMKWAQAGWSGGGGTQIHFEHGGNQYVLYSQMVRTRFSSDNRNDPMDQLGLYATRDARLVFDEHCSWSAPSLIGGNDDWIDEKRTQASLPKGEYLDPPELFYKHWGRESQPRR